MNSKPFAGLDPLESLTAAAESYLQVGRPEGSRAAEALVTGLALPILAFLWLPAFRQFATEPDPDDLKLSRPKRKRRIKRSKQRRY